MAAATRQGRNGRLPKTFLILVLAVGMALFVKDYFQTHRGRSKKKASQRAQFPFTTRPALFSTAERGLWQKLSQAVGKQYIVFGKVRLADVVRIRPELRETAARMATDEIAAISLDFVVCRESNLAIVAGAKLADTDGGSSATADEMAIAEGALAAAGVPMLRLAADRTYSATILAAELHKAKKVLAAASMEPQSGTKDLSSSSEQALSSPSAAETCPTCGAQLVRRRISGGRMNGSYVLACANYPSCRQILPLTVQAASSG
jgi:hypothetical protein